MTGGPRQAEMVRAGRVANRVRVRVLKCILLVWLNDWNDWIDCAEGWFEKVLMSRSLSPFYIFCPCQLLLH